LELIQLLNLCKTRDEQMPKDFDAFSDMYLTEEGKFSGHGVKQYLDDIAGYVSYLNREKDARQFSQPQIEHIHVPITEDIKTAEMFDKRLVRGFIGQEASHLKKEMAEKADQLTGELSDLDPNRFKSLHRACDALEGKAFKTCEKVVKRNIRELVAEAKEEVKRIRESIKETRELIKSRNSLKRDTLGKIGENIETREEDYKKYKGSILYALKNKCGIKISTPAQLKSHIGEHPDIMVYDRELSEYNARIAELQERISTDLTNHKKRMERLKKLMKTDLNDLERSVIRLTIRDDKKVFNKTMKIKRKEVGKGVKAITKDITQVKKKRDIKYKSIKKTAKKQLATEKRELRQIKTHEKKLRKTLRKQGETNEPINHHLLKDLVTKYTANIGEELKNVGEMAKQDAENKMNANAAKVAAKAEKEAAKVAAKAEKEAAKAAAKVEKDHERIRIREEKAAEKEQARHTKKLQKVQEQEAKRLAKEQLRKTKKAK